MTLSYTCEGSGNFPHSYIQFSFNEKCCKTMQSNMRVVDCFALFAIRENIGPRKPRLYGIIHAWYHGQSTTFLKVD